MPTSSSNSESSSSDLYREQSNFEPLTRFYVPNKAYALQYNVIYRKRLVQISPMLRYQDIHISLGINNILNKNQGTRSTRHGAQNQRYSIESLMLKMLVIARFNIS